MVELSSDDVAGEAEARLRAALHKLLTESGARGILRDSEGKCTFCEAEPNEKHNKRSCVVWQAGKALARPKSQHAVTAELDRKIANLATQITRPLRQLLEIVAEQDSQREP